MWVLHQPSLLLDSATSSRVCLIVGEHANWRCIAIVLNMTFLKLVLLSSKKSEYSKSLSNTDILQVLLLKSMLQRKVNESII